ncbi:MAG: TMEM175 family protein [Acidobacteriota bacterium]|nr:TMEM175 family protein [Acidobacteriota bacterium]
MASKHRLEALSDGVFAIVMTLLILDIKVPTDIAAGGLGHALRADSNEWISFAVTFGISAVYWNLQRRVFELVSDVTDVNIFLTFVFLAFVTMLPFSTSLWGHHLDERLAFVLYFGNQFVIGAALTAKLELARIKGHIRSGPEFRYMRFRLYAMCAVMVSAGLGSFYLRMPYTAYVPMGIALVARVIRRKKFPKRVRQGDAGRMELEEESLP